MSEWLKVMLEEIARKKAEAEQVRAEARRRSDEGGRSDEGSPPRPAPDTDRAQE
jgi:hypothetical protein